MARIVPVGDLVGKSSRTDSELPGAEWSFSVFGGILTPFDLLDESVLLAS
jgi:hypothetical protein